MLSKLMRCTKNCNAGSLYWSTERAHFSSTTMPDCTSHKQHFKNWMNRAIEFCFNWHFHRTSHQLTTSSSSILTTFCRENTATTGRIQKNTFQVFVESWNIDFDVIGIKKLIPCWQNVLIVMVLILINEDVFESSYNDLKFTLQNYNYFCTKYFCTKSIP